MPASGETIQIPETAPVFPLPNVVLFPRTSLPLHAFEPRYRAMVADAEAGGGCIAMALLQPGWESDYDGNPPYHGVGCLGRMDDVLKTEDGRYFLKLVGLRKVAFGGLVGEAPYRTARITPIEETVPGDHAPESREDLARLLGACAFIVQELAAKQVPIVAVKEGMPYEAVVNAVCFHAGLPVHVKQHLLEMNDVRARCLELTQLMQSHIQEIVLSRGSARGGSDNEQVN